MSSNEARQRAPKGSIKAARERAQAQMSRPENPPISRPVQVPQWPLDGAGSNSPKTSGSPPNSSGRNGTPPNGATRAPGGGEGSTPPRPKRPSEVPSILDGSKVQDPTPVFKSKAQEQPAPSVTEASSSSGQARERYWEDNMLLSPNEPDTPGTGLSGQSSRPSTTSSFGSIPDFPVPDVPDVPSQQHAANGPPRRSLGPPPTSRRGNSSYYSHNSFVAPIPEEGDGNKTHESYASSQAFPKSWVDGPPEYYMASYDEDDEDETHEWRPTNADESTGPVRKASYGRQLKPSLTTVRSNSSGSSNDGKQTEEQKPNGMGKAGVIAAAAADPLPTIAYGGPSGEESHTPTYTPKAARSGAATPKTVPTDPRVRQILGGLEKGGAIGSTDELPRSAIRRPPRLDMETVREAQSRGSVTSLPDLIKRATKLASNLDKGRTASRLGMLDMFNPSDPNLINKLNQHHELQQKEAEKRGSTISNMLSSFPAPVATPTQEHFDHGEPQRWGSPNDASNRELMTPLSPMKEQGYRPKDRRRCCGMPIWGFTLVLLIVIILIAAAIIIPIVLIVIPRNSASSGADLSNCPTSNPCQNGGRSVISANACQCVCMGGFTGKQCTVADDGSCTNAKIGSYDGATVSNEVGKVFKSDTFKIPLNATAILGALSASDITCADEDTLMTFTQQHSRRGLAKRVADPQAVTSNGVVLAGGASPTSFPTAPTLSGTGTGTSASPTPTPNSDGPSGVDEAFARVVVLWTLQKTTNLDQAKSVQDTILSQLLNGSFKQGPIDVGPGMTVDFGARSISANGTTVP